MLDDRGPRASHEMVGARAYPTLPVGRSNSRWLCLDDFEAAARRRLPRALYGFVAGGAEREASLAANRASYDAYGLVPRVLVDTSARRTEHELWDRTYAAPFGVAPMGILGITAYEGDLAVARAAAAAGIPMVLSAASICPMEEVAAAGARWYQAYLTADQARIDALLDRVGAAGFEVLVVTVDIPVPANRENNLRRGFGVPLRPSPALLLDGLAHPRWLLGSALRTLVRRGLPHMENMDAVRGPPLLAWSEHARAGRRDRLTWAHLAAIRRRWPGRLVVKGLLAAGDAVRAKAEGVDGVIVSNHGGRQLDGAIAPLRALPVIRAAVGDLAVMLDGGIRRGTDVLKALALGADFVFVGRPFNYAAAVGGQALVRHAVDLLVEEIDRDMALMGLKSLCDLTVERVATFKH